MITITPSRIRERRQIRSHTGGFTLIELMIAAGLSAVVVIGILSTFLFLGRSGANLRNYSDMEAQARQALEIFAQDVRQASAITWVSSSSVTLTVDSTTITYTHSSGAGTFVRTIGGVNRTLISGIAPGTFEYKAYNIAGNEMPLASASDLTAASSSTKQLQISLEATRTTQTVAQASNVVLSARYVLRNKIVTA